MGLCERCGRTLPRCRHCHGLIHNAIGDDTTQHERACPHRFAALDWPARLIAESRARLGLPEVLAA